MQFRMEKRRASQKGLELWLAKDSDQKQSKVSHSAYYFFICRKKRCITGNILGKKQDELVALLEAEEDFQSSQTLLDELLTKLGARSLLLPKFHCEFNPIECV